MAILYVTEFRGLASQPNDTAQAVHGTPNAEQTLVVGAVTPSAPVQPTTTIVRLHTDSICSFKIGPTGTVATTSSARMVAGQTEYLGIKPGDIVSVIANT